MIFHVVLFRPRPDVGEAERRAMFDALDAASDGIPSVRRFLIGRRVTHGATYEGMMKEDFPYSAVVEFDDLAGLAEYRTHPKHEELGRLFYALLEAALVYDYEIEDAGQLSVRDASLG